MTGITLSQAIDGHTLALEAAHRSPHTVADYHNTFRKFDAYLEEQCGKQNPPLDSITYEQIAGFLAAQSGVKKKTILNYHTGLSALWTWAIKFHHVQENVVRLVEPAKPEERAIVPYSEDDIRRIIDALSYTKAYDRPGKRPTRHRLPDADRNHAIVLLLLDTGLRATGVCSLRIIDVDLRNRYIIPFEKGDKERKLPFSARTGQVLQKYLLTRKEDRVNKPLFTTNTGQPLDRIQLLKMLNRAGERAGVKDVHPHRFRHTFAIQFLRNGGDAYTLQDMLGHTTMDMVKVYIHIAQVDIDRGHRLASPVDNWRL